jgi:hypothetical protein
MGGRHLRTDSENSSVGKLAKTARVSDRVLGVSALSGGYLLAVLEEGRGLDLDVSDGSDLLDQRSKGVERADRARNPVSSTLN